MVENITKSKLTQIDDIKTKLDPKKQKVDRLRSGAQGNGAQEVRGHHSSGHGR